MTKLNLALLASGVSIDQASNNLSIFNHIEQINITQVPFKIPEMNLVAVFRTEDGEKEQQISIQSIAPSGVTENIGKFKVRFEKAIRTRLIVSMNGFPIKEYGMHYFQLSWQGQSFDIPLEVTKLSASSIARAAIKVDEPAKSKAL